ncbi:MAG: hypothetical protein L6Q71_04420, partial [Planctomycetes bacterium]|nr:hypothetical protein [Planctomycetota bacterium]
AAFAEIGPDNMATRLSHGATLSASSSVDLPQRLIDPTIFMRLAFPGIAKVECKTGGTVNRNARLSLGTASAEGVDCALSLTLTNVYGTKDEAHCALFDVVATPSNKQVTLNNGLSVAVPAMRGVMLVDAKKGVVVSVTLEADYAGSGLGGTQLSGNVKMTLDLVDPEKDGKSK